MITETDSQNNLVASLKIKLVRNCLKINCFVILNTLISKAYKDLYLLVLNIHEQSTYLTKNESYRKITNS